MTPEEMTRKAEELAREYGGTAADMFYLVLSGASDRIGEIVQRMRETGRNLWDATDDIVHGR